MCPKTAAGLYLNGYSVQQKLLGRAYAYDARDLTQQGGQAKHSWVMSDL